jgi:polyphosphate kinase
MTGRIEQTSFLNRELSWLAFNDRVLEEASDRSTPLFERLKFASIAASNLDEFFMVRVAGLKHAVSEGETAPDLSGMAPVRQLEAVSRRAHALVDRIYRLTIDELLPELGEHSIRLLAYEDLPAERRAALAAQFRGNILPVLTPLAIDVLRPFPLLSSLSLNLAVLLEPTSEHRARRLAIVQVPPGLTRLIRLSDDEGFSVVLLEEIIRAHLMDLFPGQAVVEARVIRLARDAEMEFDDEGGRTHLEVVERELRRRRRSDVVRLEIEASASPALLDLLAEQLDVSGEDVYPVPGPLDLRILMGLTEVPGYDWLRDKPLPPVTTRPSDSRADIFATLDQQDVVLYHPYESYDPVAAFIAQAADDPDVLAIKQTLYRAGGGSSILASLLRASDRGKQVTILVELTARFDEERNIQWARALEQSGAHVIYGIRGYKTHAKVCLVVKRTPQGIVRYVHLGTGNYNERTARLYTDFSLMTSSSAIGEDASAFFSALTGYSDPPRLKKLVMAPTQLRQRLLKLIDRERRRAEAGQPAEITAKMNSLIDREIIEALYRASHAGVRIRLNVRGICALRPGMPGLSERIEVISIVDRFLEHSRVCCFLNGGDEEVFLSSADWMTRNLDKRIELMFPVEDKECRSKVLYALRAAFKDNVKARRLDADGTYHRVRPAPGEAPCRVQLHLYDYAERSATLARERVGITFQPEERKPDPSEIS